ncbi:hypothetical protein FRC06_011092 [Ceratobasidium sp. 370]|nr:hypothetical protein FRC06_011092 [Ceratobasidium sp. 370]
MVDAQNVVDTPILASPGAKGHGEAAMAGPRVGTNLSDAPTPLPGADERQDPDSEPVLAPIPDSTFTPVSSSPLDPSSAPTPPGNGDLLPDASPAPLIDSAATLLSNPAVLDLPVVPTSGPGPAPASSQDSAVAPSLDPAPALDLGTSPAPTPAPVESHALGSDSCSAPVPTIPHLFSNPISGPASTPNNQDTGRGELVRVEEAESVHEGLVVVNPKLDEENGSAGWLEDEDDIEIGGGTAHTGTTSSIGVEKPSVGALWAESAKEQADRSSVVVPTLVAVTERKDEERVKQGLARSPVAMQPSASALESELAPDPHNPDPGLSALVLAPAQVTPTQTPTSKPIPAPVAAVDPDVVLVPTQSPTPASDLTPAPAPTVELEPEAKLTLGGTPVLDLTPGPTLDPAPVHKSEEVPADLGEKHANEEGPASPCTVETGARTDQVVAQAGEVPLEYSAEDGSRDGSKVETTEQDKTRPNGEDKTNDESSIPSVSPVIGSASGAKDTREQPDATAVRPTPEVKVEEKGEAAVVQYAGGSETWPTYPTRLTIPGPDPNTTPTLPQAPTPAAARHSGPVSAPSVPLAPLPTPGSPLVVTSQPDLAGFASVAPVVSDPDPFSAATPDSISAADSGDCSAHEPTQFPVPSSTAAPPSEHKPQAEPAPNATAIFDPTPIRVVPTDPKQEHAAEHSPMEGRVEARVEMSGAIAPVDGVGSVNSGRSKHERGKICRSISPSAGPENGSAVATNDIKGQPSISGAATPTVGAGSKRKE